MARALQRVGLNLRCYTEQLRLGTATMHKVKSLGKETGDMETAMYAATTACGFRFYGGDSLPSIARETSRCIEECEQYGQHQTSILIRPLLQCCLNLMGKAAGDPVVLTGDAMDEAKLLELARVNHNTGLLSFMLMLKFALATYLDDVHCAENLSEQLRKLINRKHPPFIPIMWTIHQFYEGLVAVAIARQHGKGSWPRNQYLRTARRRLKSMQDASSHCPENFMNKVHLLEGDLEACRGNYDVAESKYRQSIVFAEHEGFVPEQALACEKLAKTFLVYGRENATKAELFLKKARSLYKEYGAQMLVDRVDKDLEALSHLAPSQTQPVGKISCLPSRRTFRDGCFVPQLSDRDVQLDCF